MSILKAVSVCQCFSVPHNCSKASTTEETSKLYLEVSCRGTLLGTLNLVGSGNKSLGGEGGED